MSEEKAAPDLFDLKFLPAWVKEAPNENPYANFAGEENGPAGPRDRRQRDRSGGDVLAHRELPRPVTEALPVERQQVDGRKVGLALDPALAERPHRRVAVDTRR